VRGASPVTRHPTPVTHVLDLLTGLVDKSLVLAEGHVGGERYRFLETIREYASAKLDEAGEAELARTRHRDWFVRLAEQAMAGAAHPEQRSWFDRLDAEHDNLRAALARCAEEPNGFELLLRLAAALGQYWQTRGYLREGAGWLELALERSATPPLARAFALQSLGQLERLDGRVERARQLLEESVALARALGDRRLLSMALRRCAIAAVIQGDGDGARRCVEEALAVSRAEGDTTAIAANLCYLGVILTDQATPDVVEAILVESVAVARESGNSGALAEPLVALGRSYGMRGDYPRARSALEESLEIARRFGNNHAMPLVLMLLGDLARAQGDAPGASGWYRQALRLYPLLGRRVAALALRRYAGLCARAGRRGRAARLFGALATYGDLPDERLAIYRGLGFDDSDAARALLGDETLARAWAEGRAMTLEQAIEHALTVEDEAIASSSGSMTDTRQERRDASAASILSAREREVATLVARGLSNRAIADALVIAPRTVDTHVSNILGKLDLHSRAQIAAWAVEHGLAGPGHPRSAAASPT
jgi:non-specific serine/threonine protein kinase